MNHFFLSFLSNAINSYLKLDPESKQRLEALQGNVITIELLPFHFIFQCEFTTTGIHIHHGETLAAASSIRGTPLQMLGALIAKENRHRFFADDLAIQGNVEIGLQLVDLFDAMQIDWEEYVAHFAGDTTAHHIGRVAKSVKKWLGQIETSFTHNVSEYIQEEKRWLPAREALQDFFEDIDTLRMDTDRMEAKIKRLKDHFVEDGKIA
jgi:ubiquinone biosynthesis protein UbiJ